MKILFLILFAINMFSCLPCFAASKISELDPVEKKELTQGIMTKEGDIIQLIDEKWLFTKRSPLLKATQTASLFLEPSVGDGAMTLVCRNGITAVGITLEKFLGNTALLVEYAFDDQPIEKIDVRIAEGGQVFVFQEPLNFIKSILHKERLTIRVFLPGKGDMELLFDISGSDGVIEPLAKECGWDLSNK